MEKLRRPIILLTILILFLIIAIGAFFLLKKSLAKISQHDGVAVTVSEDTRSIRVNDARVVPSNEYTLSAPYSEKIAEIFLEEGAAIDAAGAGILKLDTTSLELELKQYEAEVSRAKALVEKLRQGTRYEDLMIYQGKKRLAETDQKTSRQHLAQVLYDAFIRSDDAVRSKTDQMFDDPEGSSPQLSFHPSDSSLEEDLEADRGKLSERMSDWKDLADDLKSGDSPEEDLKKTEAHIRSVRSYLDRLALALGGISAGAISQDTLDAWTESLSAARSNVSAAAVAVSSASAEYSAAKRGVDLTGRELDLKIAGSDKQDIAAALSSSDAARSQADIVSERLKQATISTPEKNLVIRKIFPKKGEFVMVGTPVAVVASPGIEIEADIPESDIRGIGPGSLAIFRPTAFPGTDIPGSISRVEEQEIEKKGSVYFRVRASIAVDDFPRNESLRSGMTGDLIVESSARGKVLSVPDRYVKKEGERTIVRSISGNSNEIHEKTVETGFKKGQSIEILSGLQAGEYVVE